MEERCVCCGEQIPEGKQVCASCENCRHNTSGDFRDYCKPCIGQKQKNWEEKIDDSYGKGISGCMQEAGLKP